MIIEDVIDFFREAPPLSFLEPDRLAALARRASLEFYPFGERVLGAGGAGEGHVLAVKKGLLRWGGETYGPGSLLGWVQAGGCTGAETGTGAGAGTGAGGGDLAANTDAAEAVEDTVCYLIAPRDLASALEGRPELFDFLEDRLTPQVLELGLTGIVRELPAWLSRRPLATVTAGEAARPGSPLPGDLSLEQAARAMTEAGLDAAVVLGPEGRPAGVVTDRDFRVKAVAGGLAPDTPVSAIMTSPLVSLDARASCFDALMAMTRHHIRHVAVMAGSRTMGVLSSQELLLRQVGSPPALAARVAGASTVEELAMVSALLDQLALGLLREGARASSLGRIVGGLREALAARACQLAEEVLGPPPAGYALMLLGRAARREGPALCPLWNAVVHEPAPGADAWFERLGSFLAEALEIMHLAGAPGAPSAQSRRWRGTPDQWRTRLAGWIKDGPEDPGHLDFRPVHGQLWLAESLRTHLASQAAGRSCFFEERWREELGAGLVDTARSWSLCLGLTRISSVERAYALDQAQARDTGLACALEYLTAWQWVGEELRRGPLARAFERMCRKAAGRARDEMVAMAGP